MNRIQAMAGLISHRLSKTGTISLVPIRGNIRGVPIIIGADKPSPSFGGSGLGGTALFANIPDGIQQTNSDVETFRNEVFTSAGFGESYVPNAIGNYYVDVVIPFLKDWNQFAYKHTHGWSKFLDNFFLGPGPATWHSLNEYRQRLLDMRNAAEKLMTFNAPKPAGPNVDSAQQALNKAADAGAEIWDILKYVIIIGAIAIGVGVVIFLAG